ncbi:MAG: cobaltochelatase subunit CobN [Bacteroidales bacterium]|nr:cobaltochelatase subunit CobN [Bacteroidales bacterium]
MILWLHFLSPTRILIVNALPAHRADISLNNDSRHIKVDFIECDEITSVSKYHAIMFYRRGLYVDSARVAMIQDAAKKGVIVYTSSINDIRGVQDYNLNDTQKDTLFYFSQNPTRGNYRNLLRYLRHLSTPYKIGEQKYDSPEILPKDMFYHLKAGEYFKNSEELTQYLKREGLYNEGGRKVAFIAGVSFPVEGNRMHIDTLISRLTATGYNVYPITSVSNRRADLLKDVNPDALVYLPMGRLGNDSLVNWLYGRNIPLFMPFPLVNSHEDWLKKENPMTSGTLNARVVIPELDGAITPMCIATQNQTAGGFLTYTPEEERIDTFIELFHRQMSLRDKSNGEKRVAICYFKSPGNDALIASGLEVIPSLYNFLLTLKKNGYDLTGLPPTLSEFKEQVMTRGWIAGDYAHAAQQRIMDEASPIWINSRTYEKWAEEILLPEKYAEVEELYGKAPGKNMSRGDSLCFTALRYGNVMLFPQPRPALGDDDARMLHGAGVPPPHSYLAPYFYIQKEFDADAIIHFGTHGNLEYTPGRNAGLSQADWADVLIGPRPHFYFYTTANIGEATIAKRRTRAEIVSHLTPPFIESGMRKNYDRFLTNLKKAQKASGGEYGQLCKEIMADADSLGISNALGLKSQVIEQEDIERMISLAEEVICEKVTGAYYTLGERYSKDERLSTIIAMMADRVAYHNARNDYRDSKITISELNDYNFIRSNYLESAKTAIRAVVEKESLPKDSMMAVVYDAALRLDASPAAELNSLLKGLDGGVIYPTPGGDPVRAPNVLPTGRNMYSVNVETTPDDKAWEDGVRLADEMIEQYRAAHDGEYPHKISFTFWAGEFINSKGTTVAQAMRMLGVEPVKDGQGRVMDIKLTPSEELGRPRINVFVQISGQLRDIAASRLFLLTDAIRLAAESQDIYPNYVAQGNLEQENSLIDRGMSLERARKLSCMRIFGPVNSGYSTGMLASTEKSGEWDNSNELADRYIENMSAMYGAQENWGEIEADLLKSSIKGTDVIVQPRQSNTWGPISLDHVYEFSGALSLVSTSLSGKEPDAVMSDYRNPDFVRQQGLKESIAVETMATILNPEFIKARMKGDATTAQMFGEIFRNIFGWNVMRPSSIDPNLYDKLYKIYIEDSENLGIRDYFEKINPAAYQEMSSTMLEASRKGYWKADPAQVGKLANLQAAFAAKFGAPCTEFTCANKNLQQYISEHLNAAVRSQYQENMQRSLDKVDSEGKKVILSDKSFTDNLMKESRSITIAVVSLLAIVLIFLLGQRIIGRKK